MNQPNGIIKDSDIWWCIFMYKNVHWHIICCSKSLETSSMFKLKEWLNKLGNSTYALVNSIKLKSGVYLFIFMNKPHFKKFYQFILPPAMCTTVHFHASLPTTIVKFIIVVTIIVAIINL